MTPAEELRRLAQEALEKGDADTFDQAFVLVARQHPALYQRYRVSPQTPVIKTQSAPALVDEAEMNHWAIVEICKRADALQAKQPTLARHEALTRVLRTQEGAALKKAYDDHRAELIAAARAGRG
jgi:hypothetical protein